MGTPVVALSPPSLEASGTTPKSRRPASGGSTRFRSEQLRAYGTTRALDNAGRRLADLTEGGDQDLDELATLIAPSVVSFSRALAGPNAGYERLVLVNVKALPG